MFPAMAEEAVQQNLIDAGCDRALIRDYLAAMHSGDKGKCVHLLERRRRMLLDEIHDGQKRLDCLDYLRYQLRDHKKGDEDDGKDQADRGPGTAGGVCPQVRGAQR